MPLSLSLSVPVSICLSVCDSVCLQAPCKLLETDRQPDRDKRTEEQTDRQSPPAPILTEGIKEIIPSNRDDCKT